jgi:hypothetical protein
VVGSQALVDDDRWQRGRKKIIKNDKNKIIRKFPSAALLLDVSYCTRTNPRLQLVQVLL